MKAKNILSLNSNEVIDYFMKSEQYHSFELPEYFVFDEILEYVRKTVGEKPYHECVVDGLTPDVLPPDINIDILLNKDGRYAVRPLILCNPYLYYFYVRELCGGDNWKRIVDNFEKCTVPHIKSCAIPVVVENKEKFHRSTTILNWWNTMEQRAIELSLEYRYMFVSDITNCYGTINPQALDWALSRKNTSIPTEENHDIATNLMLYLREFQQGRNVGIPQGSTLFDLTSEIILGYSDLLLSESLKREGIQDGYEILRYRDDYRLFCNDKDMLEKISYILQQVLESLNFRLNSQKTFISDSIISDSIKPDKLAYIYNTPIFNKKGCDFDGIQKHLLYILMFARKYRNSGQVRIMLNDIDERIKEKLKPQKRSVLTLTSLAEDGKLEEKEREHPGRLCENIKAMSAICTQIALENVSVAHYALRVISRMTDSIKDPGYRNEIIDKVCKKLINQPNSTYNKLWLQNMTYRQDVQNNASPYDIRLCKVVMGEKVQLWNNSWLKEDFIKELPQDSVVNKDVLAKVTPIITFRETRAYVEVAEDDFEIPNNVIDEY